MPPLATALAAIALLSIMDAVIKSATETVGTAQIVALRYLFGLAAIVPFAWAHVRGGVVRAVRLPSLARGVLMVTTAACFFFALGRLPLLEAATFGFTAVGALGTSGMMLMARSLARARAGDIAPAEYTSLVWAFALGRLFFDETVGLAHLAGAGLVSAGCAVVARGTRAPLPLKR